MNFLAHTYLSGCNEEIIVGNFMGDYVKGKSYLDYPEQVMKGILIHRDIDSFTDMHQITRISKQRVASRYHKYAGIITDIFYDHFLASLWDNYSNLALRDFVNRTYDLLKRNYKVLPDAIKRWFPTFLENNWMMAYTTVDGIELVLERMSANTSLPDHSAFAVEVLRDQYSLFMDDFLQFFPLIIEFLEEKYKIEITSGREDYPNS
ncbi:MAG: ACP phosphodiesterase [Bacteroidales bacterium]|nr:ACP phosphodiesterase [Bacteroidales bacterium]